MKALNPYRQYVCSQCPRVLDVSQVTCGVGEDQSKGTHTVHMYPPLTGALEIPALYPGQACAVYLMEGHRLYMSS